MSRLGPARSLIALAVAAGALLVGCGVPSDSSARPVAVPTPSVTGSTTTSPVATVAEQVFLVRTDGRLVPVSRTIDALLGPQALLDQLAIGPTATETAAGLRSVLTGTAGAADVADLSPDGRLVVVRLTQELAGLTGSEQLLGIGQIVLSLGGAGAQRIEFVDSGGNPLGVPLPDGTVASTGVTPGQYAPLAAG